MPVLAADVVDQSSTAYQVGGWMGRAMLVLLVGLLIKKYVFGRSRDSRNHANLLGSSGGGWGTSAALYRDKVVVGSFVVMLAAIALFLIAAFAV